MAQEEEPTRYDTSRDMRPIKTRQGTVSYLTVKGRVAWVRAEHPEAKIVTEKIDGGVEAGWVEFKCTISIMSGITRGGEGPAFEAVAVGHASETHQDFPDFYEKAETKAIGRACAALGYDTEGARDFDDGEPLDGAAASKDERANRRMEPRDRAAVDTQHQRNVAPQLSNIHQQAQLRSLAEHGYDLASQLKAIGVETIEALTIEQAKELIIAGRTSVRGEGDSREDRPAPERLQRRAGRTMAPIPQEPNGQEETRKKVIRAAALRNITLNPEQAYEDWAKVVDGCLDALDLETRVTRQPDGSVLPGMLLNALIAIKVTATA